MKNVVLQAGMLVCAGLLLAGCETFTLLSHWRATNIAIDGNDVEWQGSMTQYGNLYIGAANDDRFLYLCLAATEKRTKAQLMGLFKQDFYVWFDPKGGRNRTFGLKFSNDSPLMKESLVNKVNYLRTPVFQIIAEEMMNNLEVEILKDNYPVAMLADAKGIDVATSISLHGRKLIYELKVPLEQSVEHSFAIAAATGTVISIGIATSNVDKGYVREPLDQASVENGMAGYRIVAARPEMQVEHETIQPVRFWGRVRLAAAH
jgi:hypothetical protein